ncbi:hypothetical protein [Paraburkholderia sp. EG304]|uniref:hypothetical protein n=1 Tax=Paraburkholderia sp. EG304 TaxID=3237015 RepID=UPI00397AA68C
MPESEKEVLVALVDLHNMLRCTELKIAHVGFETHEDLFIRMKDIVCDEENLKNLVAEIDKSNWSVDLSAPMGVRIPLSVAWDALPQELALRYFDDWYVRFVLAARIEHYIVQQCEDGAAKRMRGDVLGKTLADLNTFSRNGLLKGLGDIDLLQICDISRQYKEATGYVLVGQTLDKDLALVLSKRHTYHVQAGVMIGEPQQKERIKEMVNLMFSRPFSAEEERGTHIHKRLRDFADALLAVCKHALTKKS